MSRPTVQFWQQRFAQRQTGRDHGAPGPQLSHELALVLTRR